MQAVDLGVIKYLIKPVDPIEPEGVLADLASQHFQDKKRVVVGHEVLSLAERQEVEKEAMKIVAGHWKHHTGKGPEHIQVQLLSDRLQVRVVSALTRAERFLLRSRTDYQAVNQFRTVLSERLGHTLVPKLEDLLGGTLTLGQVQSDQKLTWTEITFNRR